MKTSLFSWLLRKLKFFREQGLDSTHPPCDLDDNFLLTYKHAPEECIAKIHEAQILGKDQAAICRNLIKLDGEYINLQGCKNDRIRAEKINRYLDNVQIKPSNLAKARRNPRT